jgi:UDP-N-acetylmuramyl pentapeptide phosphotransferase/UDP-N-acetylglucosamine-1-phosphate transferase
MTTWHGFELEPLAAALIATWSASWLLVLIARRIGWTDGGTSSRKRGVAPLPLVGGAAVLIGIVCAWAWIAIAGREHASFVPGRELGQLVAGALGPSATLWPLGGLVTAFVVGTIDDVLADGLRPRTKLVGQALSGCVLGLPLVVAHPANSEAWVVLALLAFAAVVALNAVNTFDNADGAATGLGLIAFAFAAPPFAAALAAFVPFNLARGREQRPRAILGDAGSHVVGFLFLLAPSAWLALALPILDGARVAFARWRLGHLPWEGDRRHLAHRFEALGWSPARVALVLAAISAPSAFLSASSAFFGEYGFEVGVFGLAATLLLFVWAVRRAPAPLEPRGERRSCENGGRDVLSLAASTRAPDNLAPSPRAATPGAGPPRP